MDPFTGPPPRGVPFMPPPSMRENKTHMTAKEQIDAVIARVHELNGRRDAVYARLMEKLEEQANRGSAVRTTRRAVSSAPSQ